MATDSQALTLNDQLAQLDADRQHLSERTRVPWGLAAAGGAGLAWFVADAAAAHPGTGYRAGGGYLIAVAALLIVAHLIQRETGIRFRRFGTANWLITAAVVVITLMMFSASLALVSLGARWAAALLVLVTWALGTWAVGVIVRNGLRGIGRG